MKWQRRKVGNRGDFRRRSPSNAHSSPAQMIFGLNWKPHLVAQNLLNARCKVTPVNQILAVACVLKLKPSTVCKQGHNRTYVMQATVDSIRLLTHSVACFYDLADLLPLAVCKRRSDEHPQPHPLELQSCGFLYWLLSIKSANIRSDATIRSSCPIMCSSHAPYGRC